MSEIERVGETQKNYKTHLNKEGASIHILTLSMCYLEIMTV